MSSSDLTALFDTAAAQCQAIVNAAGQPDTHAVNVRLQALEFVLRALDWTADESPAAQAFVDAYRRMTEVAVDVNLHLKELAADWKCAACQQTRAGSALVSRVLPGTPVVRLRCAACAAVTPLTEAGDAAFRRVFSANLGGPWNPGVNNFEWDST